MEQGGRPIIGLQVGYFEDDEFMSCVISSVSAELRLLPGRPCVESAIWASCDAYNSLLDMAIVTSELFKQCLGQI